MFFFRVDIYPSCSCCIDMVLEEISYKGGGRNVKKYTKKTLENRRQDKGPHHGLRYRRPCPHKIQCIIIKYNNFIV